MKKINVFANNEIKNYFEKIQEQASEQYELAKKMRSKGNDINTIVEMTPAVDLADRAETLINLPGLAKRYREVISQTPGRREAYFQLFKEIIEQKWCKIPDEQKRLEIGIKACLLIETEGVVVAPLDGLPKVEINKNPDGSRYVDIYYAGPIRAAGGSSTVIPLILGDYGRKLLKLDKYKPTRDEVERYIEEVAIYQTEVVSRQYIVPDSEIKIIVENCPVCINGTPTEQVEVSVNRDLPRIPTNRIRGGVGLVISEGLALKALWVLNQAQKHGLEDNWKFLEQIVKVEKKQAVIEIKPNKKLLEGLAAGRPVLAYPSKWGGFRLRYGRNRNTGIMAKAINPATMILLDEFIAVGTHGKLERPGKATQFFPCDTIDGPIVLLNDGEVKQINSIKEAEEIKHRLKKIIYLGDLLISYGDFRKSAHPLIPPGYVEEWWFLELEKAIKEVNNENLLKKINFEKIKKNIFDVDEEEAILISKELKIPFYPKYIYYYNALNIKEIKLLHNYFLKCELTFDNKLVLEKNSEFKNLIERIGLPHFTENEKIIINHSVKSIIETFSLKNKKNSNKESVLDYLSEISGMIIKDKAGSFIGGRMGRPEQAKRRQMKGNPHCLFPIGLFGGNIRSINKAIDEHNNSSGEIDVEIAIYENNAGEKTSYFFDKKTNNRNLRLNYCSQCKKFFNGEMCKKCGAKLVPFGLNKINLRKMVFESKENLKVPLPDLIKGVQGLISDTKESEPIEKGILRARNNVHIFRDGTSRFELLNAVITHFKPKEINLTVDKVKKLGYVKDYLGQEIVDENQLIEIFPQDIIVNETCGDWMLDVANFVDDELELFYKEKRFYNAKTKEDLIGTLVLGLAPHTSAGVTARVIGYTKSRLGYGHPYFICAKRRNVDGDQDSIMLLMDGLLNFSQKFLANRNGGKMDSAIVFSTIVIPTEIDDEVHNMETMSSYPLKFYELANKIVEPFIDFIDIVEDKLTQKDQYSKIDFTHTTEIFDEGPKTSQYIQLKTMEEKINRQNQLQKKILAVNAKDALERVMGSHFLPDIIGNARAFSRQTFRCTSCNEKYRRIPLSGKCYKCGKDTLILTIHQGSVRKYLKIAQNLARQEELSPYLIQRLDMIEKEIDSVFNNDKVKQKGLFDFV